MADTTQKTTQEIKQTAHKTSGEKLGENDEWAEMAEEIPESCVTQIGRLGAVVGGGTNGLDKIDED